MGKNGPKYLPRRNGGSMSTYTLEARSNGKAVVFVLRGKSAMEVIRRIRQALPSDVLVFVRGIT